MSVRLKWSLGIAIALLTVSGAAAITVAQPPATGTVRVVIGPAQTSRVIDVALIDASGQEYAGSNRGAGQSEALELIPVGRVKVNVGSCSTPAEVQAARTVVVHFNGVDCLH